MYPASAYSFLLPVIAALNNSRNSYPYPSDYKDRSNIPPGYNAWLDTHKGYDAGPDSHSGYNDHKKVTDASKVCDNVRCGEGQCNPVMKDAYSTPEPFCGTVDGNPQVPVDANAGCRVNGLTTAVLMGDTRGFLPLEPLICYSHYDCPYGTMCITNACCYGLPNCTDALSELFQDSFEFNGRTYAVSANVVGSDIQAQAICLAQGGYLAEIESREEDDAIRNFLLQTDLGDRFFAGVLISGTDRTNEGEFVYQYSGRNILYSNFEPDQPDNFDGDQDCLDLHVFTGFLWDDEDCFRGELLFLCEFPQVPEIDRKKSYPSYH